MQFNDSGLRGNARFSLLYHIVGGEGIELNSDVDGLQGKGSQRFETGRESKRVGKSCGGEVLTRGTRIVRWKEKRNLKRVRDCKAKKA